MARRMAFRLKLTLHFTVIVGHSFQVRSVFLLYPRDSLIYSRYTRFLFFLLDLVLPLPPPLPHLPSFHSSSHFYSFSILFAYSLFLILPSSSSYYHLKLPPDSHPLHSSLFIDFSPIDLFYCFFISAAYLLWMLA